MTAVEGRRVSSEGSGRTAARRAAATILDVAGRARVSPATVSRVLNGSAHAVHAATRRRVLAAARVLGYVPNMAARSLLTRQTAAIGVLVPDVSNPYYAVILRGIEDTASRTGHAVILCNTDRRGDKQQTYLRTLLERRVDGLILAGGTFRREALTPFGGWLPPAAAIGRHDLPLPSIRVDNVGAAAAATRHLITLGHRRIACLAGPRTSLTAADRRRGYLQALREAGLAPRAEYLIEADFTLDGGRAGGRLFTLNPAPTAVVASSDQMAIGVIRALHEMGRAVPRHVSVVGFDDSPLAAHAIPALTSVAIPMYEMGCRAMNLLLRLLRGEPAAGVVLPAELRIRETTAAPEESRAPVA